MRINPSLMSEKYSTSEEKTNKVWKDGKPIYRKVVTTNTGTGTGTWTKIVSLSIDTLIKIDGFWVSSNDCYPLGRSYNNEEQTIYWKSDGIYEIHNYSFANNRSTTIVVEYTKP